MNLNEVVQRATAVLEQRRARKTEKVYIKSLDADIEFHGLTPDEREDILDTTRGSSRNRLKRLVYAASDDLRKIALELANNKVIGAYEDVVDLFSETDLLTLVGLVNTLSGIGDKESDLIIGKREAVKN